MMRCRECLFAPCRCDMLAERRPPGLSGNTPAGWPMCSEALAVHPSQVKEVMARNKKYGITGVTYNKQGQAVLADQSAKTQLCKLEGVHEKNACYGGTYAGNSPLPPTQDEGLCDEGVDITFNTEVQK